MVHNIKSGVPVSIKGCMQYTPLAFYLQEPFVCNTCYWRQWRIQSASVSECVCLHMLVIWHLRIPMICRLFAWEWSTHIQHSRLLDELTETRSHWGSYDHPTCPSSWRIRDKCLPRQLEDLDCGDSKGFQTVVTFSQFSIAGLNDLVDQDAQSLVSSDAAESMLLVPSISEVLDVVGEGK